MSETLTAVKRTEFGKGAARRTRRAGQIPAVLYGQGLAPVHLALPGHDTFMQIKGKANPVLNLDIEGRKELALVKDVQRDPVRAVIEHIDLILVRRGEKVSVDVPVVVIGEAPTGVVFTQELSTLKVLADAASIPAQLEIAIDAIESTVVVRAADVVLPTGVVLEEDPEAMVLNVVAHEAAAEEA